MASGEELPERFWNLVEEYRGELVNQALAILGNLEDAEDVAQETLCEAFRDTERLAQAESLGAWLRTLNRANALDRLRKRRRDSKRVERKQAERPARPFTTGGFSLLEMRESLAKAIEELPEELRTVVVLRFWEHHSYEQIAARLKVPTTTVWRMFFEASEILAQKLKHELEAPAPAGEDRNPTKKDDRP